MDDNVLLTVTVSREKDEIFYQVNRANDLSNEELEYYLREIIDGICTWKPGVCVQDFKGKIRKKKTAKKGKK